MYCKLISQSFDLHCSGIVEAVQDSGGVYFVPGFHGLPSPISDPSASAGNLLFKKMVLGSTVLTESEYIEKLREYFTQNSLK